MMLKWGSDNPYTIILGLKKQKTHSTEKVIITDKCVYIPEA